MPELVGPHFSAALLTRPPLTLLSVVATLQHFALISYAVDPARVRPQVDERYELDCFVQTAAGPRVLVSVVPFADQDFRFVRLPWVKFRFGQTNYRTYVIDRQTGERGVWFFGTSLDSWTVVIPRNVWQLPWHRGRISFDCDYDLAAQRYTRYQMSTKSNWAAVELALHDTGEPCTALAGISDFEAGWVLLTHPLAGFYYRRDGRLGSYRVWHDRLRTTNGKVLQARFGLLDRLGVLPYAEQSNPHSVLIQHQTEFTVYLPPEPLAVP